MKAFWGLFATLAVLLLAAPASACDCYECRGKVGYSSTTSARYTYTCPRCSYVTYSQDSYYAHSCRVASPPPVLYSGSSVAVSVGPVYYGSGYYDYGPGYYGGFGYPGYDYGYNSTSIDIFIGSGGRSRGFRKHHRRFCR